MDYNNIYPRKITLKKNILITIIISMIVFMFGVAVGHYKIPPFSQLITLKKSSCNSKFRTPRGPDTIITYKKNCSW